MSNQDFLLKKHASIHVVKDIGADAEIHTILVISNYPSSLHGVYELIGEEDIYRQYPIDDSEITWGTHDEIQKKVASIFGYTYPPNRDDVNLFYDKAPDYKFCPDREY